MRLFCIALVLMLPQVSSASELEDFPIQRLASAVTFKFYQAAAKSGHLRACGFAEMSEQVRPTETDVGNFILAWTRYNTGESLTNLGHNESVMILQTLGLVVIGIEAASTNAHQSLQAELPEHERKALCGALGEPTGQIQVPL